ALPEGVEHDALIVMGGPQQAYDDNSGPWLRQTKELMRRTTKEGLPVLGICLGAQLLAEAMGGRVRPGEQGPELGARLVAKRDAGGVVAAGLDPEAVAERAVEVLPEIEQVWRPFAERFAALVRGETRTYLPVV